MAHHVGITSTYSVTVPAGGIAQEVSRTRSVELSKVAGTDGEWAKVSALKQLKTDVQVSGVGPANLGAVSAGNVVAPSTMKVLSVQQGEKSSGDNRATFVISATGMSSFDPSTEGTPAAAGDGEPDEDTLGIVGITLALSETFNATSEVKDLNVPATDGTPGARATVGLESSFSGRGAGDIPASLSLGLAGIEPAGFGAGLTIVRSINDVQKAQEINTWGFDANNFPAAA